MKKNCEMFSFFHIEKLEIRYPIQAPHYLLYLQKMSMSYTHTLMLTCIELLSILQWKNWLLVQFMAQIIFNTNDRKWVCHVLKLLN